MHVSNGVRHRSLGGHARAGWVFAACLAWVGCGGDEEPATREDVISACRAYNRASCQAFAGCIPLSQPTIAACIAEGDARCQPELAPDWCWNEQSDAYNECAADVEEESCSTLCSGGACEDRCVWVCPPSPG